MEQITMNSLGTMAGGVAATTLITQALKKYVVADPKWITLAVGLVIGIFAKCMVQPITVASLFLGFVNGLFIAGASVGTFEAAVKPVERNLEKGGGEDDENTD